MPIAKCEKVKVRLNLPFAPEEARHKRFKAAAFDAGQICYPMGGTIDGRRGDHVLIAPPFIISDDQIGDLVGKWNAQMGRPGERTKTGLWKGISRG